jgi:hypothetical protein
MIKIGYLGSDDPSGLETLEECQPQNVKLLDSRYVKLCPSIKGYYMNTYEIKCPFDLEWTITHKKDGGFDWDINTEKTSLAMMNPDIQPIDMLGMSPDGRVCQIHPHPVWSFVSDTKNTIMIQHSNGIDTNPQIITGQLDIYKWPDRPLSVAYYVEKDTQTFTLRRGQPWYRLTFITPELDVIRLVRMYKRCDFLERTKNKSKLPVINKLNWRKIFNYFGNNRPKKLIKEN